MRFLPCLFVGLLLGGSLPVTADILYSVTDLGTLGGDYSIGLGLNNAGQVTGWSNASAPAYVVHAFLYSNGQMTDLGTLGGSQSFGSGINNAGQVTGYAALPLSMPSDPYAVSVNHAFLYSNGQMTDLGTLDGSFSIGNSINNAGQVTGFAGTSDRGFHAFLYSNGEMRDLGTLGGFVSVGHSINNAGQVTGSSYISVGITLEHAFLYTDGQMNDIGTLGGPESYGYGINDRGQVTGSAYTAAGYNHAFLYTDGQMNDIGTLGGPFFSSGLGINNAGQVVGLADTSTGDRHAFLYRNGQMVDLNDWIDPALGLTLNDATAINDQGQIVANHTTDLGERRAYLLTPVPEPSTLALFGVALLGLGVWVHRHPTLFR